MRVGAWEKLFGDLTPTDFTALDNAKTLDAGGKLALLYWRETPDALLETMTGLRFSKRKAADAANALAVLKTLINRHGEAADALRYGLPALKTANSMLHAVGNDPAALERAETLLRQVWKKRLPESLKDLAVGGNDLLKLARELRVPKERIGDTLVSLWRDTVNGQIDNERDALLSRARRYFIDSKIYQ